MEALGVSATMVGKIRQRCVEEGVDAALEDRPRPGAAPKLTEKQCAHVIALACTPAPEGHDHWTLRLLADQGVQLGFSDSFSHEAVRQLLKKHPEPWQQQEWCIPEVGADFVAPMEDVLDLYEAPYDPAYPVVCFDESPKQLIGEVRTPIPVEPGAPARYDVEYVRHGVRDLMMMCEPKRGWREALITERRTKIDFTHTMKYLVECFPEATTIRVVLDNLNTHKPASLYEAFPPEEARAIARKLEFHYTPKQGSWLNIAEMELAVLSNRCLSQRIPDEATLRRHVETNIRERNAKALPVKWRFKVRQAARPERAVLDNRQRSRPAGSACRRSRVPCGRTLRSRSSAWQPVSRSKPPGRLTPPSSAPGQC